MAHHSSKPFYDLATKASRAGTDWTVWGPGVTKASRAGTDWTVWDPGVTKASRAGTDWTVWDPGVTKASRATEAYSAFLGQAFTHSMHRMHSVPFLRLRASSSMSTFMGQTRRHFPHWMYLSWSQVMRVSAK